MKQMTIQSQCSIQDGAVFLNQEQVERFSESADFQDFMKFLYKKNNFKYSKFYKMDSFCKLAWMATEYLLQNQEMSVFESQEIGLVFSNSQASLATDRSYYQTVKDFASPALFVYTLPNIMLGEISIRHGFKGENAFLVSENYDEKLLFDYAKQLFRQTTTQAVLLGWIDYKSETDYVAKVSLCLSESRKNDITN